MTKITLRPVPFTYTDEGAIVGVATDIEAAAIVFYQAPSTALVLCVDVPRAAYVNSLHDAEKFFNDEGEIQ